MRLSSAESGAIGSSGSAAESTFSASRRTSRPPSFTRSSAHRRARQRQRRLHGQRGDPLVELARRVLLGEHHLDEARFVAHDHELHALLVADRVDPAADRDLLSERAPAVLRSACGSRPGPYPSEAPGRASMARATFARAGAWCRHRQLRTRRPGRARPRPRSRRPRSSAVARSSPPPRGRLRRARARAGARECRARAPARPATRMPARASDLALRTSRSTSTVTSSAVSSPTASLPASPVPAQRRQLTRVGPGGAVHRALLPPRPHLLAHERQERREQPLEDRQRRSAARGSPER